jgi:hypothetical protein
VIGVPSDATGSLRNDWAMSVVHKNPFTFTHDRLNGAPEGATYSPAVNFANGSLQTAFWGLHGLLGWIGAWNASLFVAILGSSLAMFWFLDRLGCTFLASLFGGYVYGFSSYALERAYAGHLGLIHNWLFVVLLAVLLRLSGRPTIASAAVVGCIIGLAFYITAYQGLFAAFMALVFFGILVVRGRSSSERFRTVGLGVSAYVVCGITLVPILALYFSDQSAVRALAGHQAVDLSAYAASASAYLLPSPRNPLFHWLRGDYSASELTEHTLFFGYTTLALAVVAYVLLVRRDRWLSETAARWETAIFVCVLGPAALLMSLPPSYRIGRVSVPTPSTVIGHVSTYWRVYSRFGVLVGLSVAVASALALSALARRYGWARRILAPAAIVLVFLELLPGNVGAVDSHTRPPWIAWLAAHPHGIVATYPFNFGDVPATELNQADYWYQRLDGHPRFQTEELDLTSRNQAVRFLARDVEDPLAARVLATEGVRYAVLHDDVYRADGQSVPTPGPSSFTLLRKFGDVRIYSVKAPRLSIAKALTSNEGIIATLEGLTAPAVTFGTGFNDPEPYNGTTGRWMIQDGGLEVDNAGASMKVSLRGLVFANEQPRILEVLDPTGRVLGRQLVPTYAVPLHLGPFKLAGGRSSLTLVSAPGPQSFGASDPRRGSVFLSSVVAAPVPAYEG